MCYSTVARENVLCATVLLLGRMSYVCTTVAGGHIYFHASFLNLC